MARRTAGMGNRTFVTTTAGAIDLGNTGAPDDIATGMLCPGDGAKVVTVTFTTQTAGDNAQNHGLVLEHGLTTDGVALTPSIKVLANAVAGTIVTGGGLSPQGQPNTVYGTQIQIQSTEDGAIGNGAILDISVLWEL